MYKPNNVIKLISSNMKKAGNPLGALNLGWQSKHLKVPSNGEFLLFTGLLYQLMPYIEKMVSYLEKLEDSILEKWIHIAGSFPAKILNAIVQKEEKEYPNLIIENIATILRKLGIQFYYRQDLDRYSGILLYDFGDDEGFKNHASFVGKALQEAGVKKIITIDPHTTYALKILYPKYTGFSFDVFTYIELVAENIENMEKGNEEMLKVTIHDSCYYARYLGILNQPREIMNALGIKSIDTKNSKNLTSCCGGPIESISPNLSKEIARNRVKELQKSGCDVIAMCPICIINLKKGGAKVKDFSTIVRKCMN